MTTLEFMSDGLIPYPSPHTLVMSLIHFPLATIATLSSLFVILAIHKAGPYQDSKFLTSLCISHLLHSAHIIIVSALNFHYRAFSIGKIGCVIGAGVLFVTAGTAVFSVAVMAINMYLVLIKGVYMTDWQKDAIIIGFWVWLIALPASFLPTDFRFKGMPNFTNRYDHF